MNFLKRIAESSPQQGTCVYGPMSRTTEESIRWKRDSCTVKSNNRWKGHKRKAQVRVIYFRIQIMAKDKQYRHLLHRRFCKKREVRVLRVYRCGRNTGRRQALYFGF